MSRSIEPYILTKRNMSGSIELTKRSMSDLIEPDILPPPTPCYSSVRIEFQKEDKMTHRRYASSFERITQQVDKVEQYISVINLGSRYSPRPSAGRKTKMTELEIKMVRAQVDANLKRSLTHSTQGLRMKKSTVHNILISDFKLKPYLINILHFLSRADPVKPEVISNWLLAHP